MTEKMGRGIVAAKDIPVGTLLMASRGVGVYQDEVGNKETGFVINYKDHVAFDHGSVKMVALTNQDIKNTPVISKKLAALYYGEHDAADLSNFSVTEADLDNPPPLLSADRIRSIVKFNSFSDDGSPKRHGIWPLPSLANHDCFPNSTRFCIGEMMFIHSATAIKAGQEIFLGYVPLDAPYPDRKKTLDAFSIPKCQCRLCDLDRQESQEGFAERARLSEHMNANYSKYIRNFDPTITPKMVEHIQAMKNTYKDPNRPLPIALFHPITGLGLLHQAESNEKALKTYLECLAILGWKSFDASELKRTPANSKIANQTTTKFQIKCPEFPLFYAGIDLFFHVADHASKLGYTLLARKSIALSHLCANIFEGVSSQEQAIIQKAKRLDPHLLSFKDTIEFI
ncbi:hypothetical protein DFA_11164 [Cavenderia fasciculata]|uniref:SET domain-containing protein n=1 Tax=Cavenderia fasciculata TaxID=261658 RepID=F4QF96_CACFS|nr:uncharacterized protein DFA_11164 [Cavenderia fasciculata]EGG13403.1 hypothetical protein DFA_11164 [Cavenderia fasciculata]|eukprot:XP_004350107.1 hypothetical protein DFA_11164 [Cavenderia fasciculata]